MALYDYATEGITAGREEQRIVLDTGFVLKLLQTEMMWVSDEWFEIWAAAGFDDTLLRWKMKLEVANGHEKEIQPRVQA